MQNYDGYEKGYANMRLVVKEKEDYTFAPFSKVETYDKVTIYYTCCSLDI